MLNKIIHFSLYNRLVVLILSGLILIGGTIALIRSEIDIFPDLNAPTVVIMTEAPGLAPEEVERLVTFPVETAVNGATGIRRVRSSSAMGFRLYGRSSTGRRIFTAHVRLYLNALPLWPNHFQRE